MDKEFQRLKEVMMEKKQSSELKQLSKQIAVLTAQREELLYNLFEDSLAIVEQEIAAG